MNPPRVYGSNNPKIRSPKKSRNGKKMSKNAVFWDFAWTFVHFFFLEIFSEDKKKNGVFWKHENMEKRFFSKHPLQTKKYAWKERKPSSLFTVMGSSIFYYFLFKKWKINASTVKQKTLPKNTKKQAKNHKNSCFLTEPYLSIPMVFS